MDAPRRCLATFRPFRVEIAVTGNGRVTTSRGDVDCADSCSFNPLAATTTLFATAATGWRFDSWGGD